MQSNKYRVRIAPSPTGPLHIGTARTALFNYLFAKKNNGTFILRIEDTDLERSDKAFENDIFENLKWLGLVWDEGPDVGGPVAPYRQSERTSSYKKHIRKLLDINKAYYCFCSEEELAAVRDEQQKANKPLRYSGKCSMIARDTAQERIAKKGRAIIRFRMPEREMPFDDLIRGEISFDMRLVGDIAIAKDEETPLYNFAAVVDDAEMQISHVLRGEDHIANTPKQIAIGEALKYTSPQYGHFPLILGPDRSKLSKRHGTAMTVRELRKDGYFPEAVVNFLAFLGWNPGTEEEMFTLKRLVNIFDLLRVQKSGAIWDQRKLVRVNRIYAEKELQKKQPQPPEEAVRKIQEIASLENWAIPPGFSISGVTASSYARTAPSDIESEVKANPYYFVIPDSMTADQLRWKDMSDEDIRGSLTKSLDILNEVPVEDWNYPHLREVLELEAEKWGSGDRGRLLYPLRMALSGAKRSDSPFELAAWRGKAGTLQLLQKSLGVV